MKIQTERQQTVPSGGGVVIAQNIIRKRETLDRDGNVIDPRTKQIIQAVEMDKEQTK
jgi:hypothetical protein